MHLQFHHSGFKPGPPTLAPRPPSPVPTLTPLPPSTDVLIIGAGAAGLVLAAQLSQFEDISVTVAEQKPGRLKVGQADGIQCRSIEMFEAFGFSGRVLGEGYWVNETCFWRPVEGDEGIGGERKGIRRAGRIRDVEEGLSEFPHVILNQARIADFWLDVMAEGARPIVPSYRRRLVGMKIDRDAEAKGEKYPVTCVLETVNVHGETDTTAKRETVKAQYVVGCDGARSNVRRELGLSLKGDSANAAWGVMDILCITSFPDIRFKCVVHSAKDGNMVIIPREGGYLVRLYIELDKLAENERVREKEITKEVLIEAARRILWPHTLDVKEVAWWSVYEIGQRLCDRFDDLEGQADQTPRVFITGDACHTHSPKAGQGMNVSMQDGYNIGWKLAAVLRGQADESLLSTYSSERHEVAKVLIEFDRELAQMISGKTLKDGSKAKTDPAEFQRYFTQSGRYTAGLGYRYQNSMITALDKSVPWQHLAKGFPAGERFHSSAVVRFWDAKPVQLGHTVRGDGRFRIMLFNDAENPIEYERPVTNGSTPASAGRTRLSKLCRYLEDHPESPIRKYTEKSQTGAAPHHFDIDNVIEVLAVLQQGHEELQTAMQEKGGNLPSLLTPSKGKYGLKDTHKVFCDEKPYYNIWDSTGDWKSIYEAREVSQDEGAMIIIRPDGYVAAVFPLGLVDGRHPLLEEFFGTFMKV